MVSALEVEQGNLAASVNRGGWNDIHTGKETVLDAFRAYDQGEGPDVYTVAAAGIWSKPAHLIDKEGDERQTGKVSVLALGFGGGAGAYGSMAKIYQLAVKFIKAFLGMERL